MTEDWRKFIEVFENVFLEELQCTYIIPHFIIEIGEVKCKEILKNNEKMNERFYKWMKHHADEKIFQKLLDILKTKNFDKPYKKLSLQETNDREIFKRIIVGKMNILKEVDYFALLKKMLDKNFISLTEFENLKDHSNKSNRSLIFKLIIHISCCKDDWFATLVEYLDELKETQAFHALNKYLLCSDSDKSLSVAIQSLEIDEAISEEFGHSLTNNMETNKKLLRRVHIFMPKLLKVDPIPICEYLGEHNVFSDEEVRFIEDLDDDRILKMIHLVFKLSDKADGCIHLIIALHENKERAALHDLGLELCDFTQSFADIKKFMKKVISIDDEDLEILNKRPRQDLSGANIIRMTSESQTSSTNCSSSLSLDAGLPVTATSKETPDLDPLQQPDCKSLLFDLKSDDELLTEKKKTLLNGSIVQYGKLTTLESKSYDLVTEVSKNGTTMSSVNSEDTITNWSEPTRIIPKELKLREYQKELAENARQGRNCIIVAPTGSGKTHVAMYIIQDHVQNRDNKKPKKVVFMVPTVALVEQQKSLFQEYISRNVVGITGEYNIPFSQLIELNEIFVITPQILENSLKEDSKLMKQLTLMIFDECHHTKKEHPYNAVMARYHNIRDEDPDADLPQVIGFTASVGVGKAKTLEEAKDYILNICANLNAPYVSTVKKHVDELTMFTNNPLNRTIICKIRESDPFKDALYNEMITIEKIILNNKEEIIDLNSVSERGCDPYVQWLSRLSKKITAIYRQDIRLEFISYYEFLKIYNEALLINDDCRTKDAINYIEQSVQKFDELSDSTKPQNIISLKLRSNWTKMLSKIESVATDPKYNNPKLEQIKSILLGHYPKKYDSRCIIFCKTRELTAALVNWMKETEELKFLNAETLIGINKGQTNAVQNDVLRKFQRGECKLVVATSVAEEGLDVQKCNLVIRYGHVTNEIATAQTRGRARAADSRTILVVEQGSNVAMKEEINILLEKMMNKAIVDIQDLTPGERRKKILDYQEIIKFERKMNEQAKIMGAEKKNNDPYEIRCLKCDNMAATSDDIRKIENAHHVVIDPAIKGRITVKPHPRPKVIENSYKKIGKIHCKWCDSDWGIMASYKNVLFPIIKICSFITRNNETGAQVNIKRWKDVPFQVISLTDEDLKGMAEFNNNLYKDVIPPDQSISCSNFSDSSSFDYK